MSQFLFEIKGVRGRSLKVYDNKCEIITEITLGSIVSGNSTDGEKTIFYIDITGVQFKKSKLAIGYLQFETPSMQMNNQNSNFFSENTFTFEEANGVTNEFIYEVYRFIVGRIEQYKYCPGNHDKCAVPERLARLVKYYIEPNQKLRDFRTDWERNQPKSSGGRGNNVEEKPWTCVNCGTENSYHSNYCMYCETSKEYCLSHEDF